MTLEIGISGYGYITIIHKTSKQHKLIKKEFQVIEKSKSLTINNYTVKQIIFKKERKTALLLITKPS